MLQVLRNDITGNMYWAIKSIYANTTSKVNINDYETDIFRVTNGVRQGDPLSPTLFSIYINDLIDSIKQSNIGVNIDNLLLNILVFADDVALIAKSEDDLQQLLNIVTNWCRKWRLSINNDKSAIIHFRNNNNARTNYQFMLNNNVINIVSEYKYLGVIMHEYLDYNHTVKPFTVAAGRALGGMINKFRSMKNVGYATFRKLYESCVTPIMEYGSAVWGSTKQFKGIDKIQQRALRFYLGVHRFSPLHGIEGDMAFTPHEVGRKMAACRLWNRILKMDDLRMTKKLLFSDIRNEGSFSSSVHDICDECNMLVDFENLNVLNTELLFDRLMQNYQIKWLQNVEMKPKLRTYKLYKSSYKVESYCKFFIPKYQRSLLCQLRLGILPIQLEVGRYTGKPINERICLLCNNNVVEDENHFLFECPFSHIERERFVKNLSFNDAERQTFLQSTIAEKLNFLFTERLFKFGNYIETIYNKRRRFLYH